MSESSRVIEILLVEDSDSDARITKIALEQSRLLNHLTVIRDGKSALQFLNQDEGYENSARPDLIFLDLNLPKLSGRKVLAAIRSDCKLSTIPVAILTVSESDEDVLKESGLQANCYITKPLDLPKIIEAVKYIENFWVSIVKKP